MGKQILIDPVTRIEGHAKITIQLDDQGAVQDARLHITQFRGFEKFCEGRPFHEMPSLMARICGICPVSHLMASAKACDALMAVKIPETADQLRRIMNLAQIIQSHALSFFHLSSPDLLLGMDADPKTRNILGLLESHPEIAKDGVALRRFGQQVIERLGDRRVHPAWVVPGGVNHPLTEENRQAILKEIPDMLVRIERTLVWFRKAYKAFQTEIDTFANFPSIYLGLVSDTGTWEHYNGPLRIMGADGKILQDHLKSSDYAAMIGEAVEPWSYLKFPYYKPQGYPNGLYRVGPLARLNLVEKAGVPKGDAALAEFKALTPGAPVTSSFHYHYARLVEIVMALEWMERHLQSPSILSKRVRASAGPNALEGVGVSEAPRGTLIHHYKIDEQGLIRWANLVIATGHNNLAMNRGITQAARHFVKADRLQEGMLNRVEAVIRTYDPCLSCSTHAAGQMPLLVQLRGPNHQLLDEMRRD